MTEKNAAKTHMSGVIRKMHTTDVTPVGYALPVGDELFAIDQCIGESLSLTHTGNIYCLSCGRKTNKSFSQGYCYPCFKSLPECDMCIMKPETCHYSQGTCRDEKWGEANCMQPHFIYLANSSGFKVGITRHSQLPTRWFDQGATQAVPLFKVSNRLHSGLVETVLKKYISDRTDWRKMLKGEADVADLAEIADKLLLEAADDLQALQEITPDLQLERLGDETKSIRFPVTTYPIKVSSLNLDKTPSVGGVLQGIKGQYLIFDTGVINMRKYAGYELEIVPG